MSAGVRSAVDMQFCMQCGSGAVERRIPELDNRPRDVCSACGHIHYENPRVIAGCLALWQDRILLCKRNIDPRMGLWSLPAGFMESGETAADAAIRETLEEANSRVEVTGLYALLSLPHADQVYAIYRARMLGPECAPGVESQSVALVTPEQIPWDQLAFATIRYTLELYLADLQHGVLRIHAGDVLREDGGASRLRLHAA